MSGFHITSFIQAHRDELERVSLTEDELVMVLKPTLDLRTAMVLFADLITYVTPKSARIWTSSPYTITLRF